VSVPYFEVALTLNLLTK